MKEPIVSGCAVAVLVRNRRPALQGVAIVALLWLIEALFATAPVLAQDPWFRLYGQVPGYDYFIESLLRTPDGGYIAGGDDQNVDDMSTDAWICRFDSLGHPIWQSLYGPRGRTLINDMQPTSDGGFIAAGALASPLLDGLDFMVFKISSAGRLLWMKTLTGDTFNGFRSIRPTHDGGFILAGWSYDQDADVSHGSVFKIDSSGNCIWRRSFAPASGCSRVEPLVGGGYIGAGGYLSGNYAFGWVVKLGEDGEVLWQKALDVPSGMFGGVSPSPDGGFVLTGASQSAPNTPEDIWLAFMDSNGSPVWQYAYGGSDDEGPDEVVTTPDGGFLVSGFSQSFTHYMVAWVFQVDHAGQLVWQRQIDDAGSEAHSCLANPDGTVTATGWGSFPSLNSSQMFMTRFSPSGDPVAECPFILGATLGQQQTSFTLTNASIPSTLDIPVLTPWPLTVNSAVAVESDLCSEPYSFFFWDDQGRSRFCVNSSTGDYQFTVLGSQGAASYHGTCLVRQSGSSWLFYSGASPFVSLSVTYSAATHSASGFFLSSKPLRYSFLRDTNTSDDPQQCQ